MLGVEKEDLKRSSTPAAEQDHLEYITQEWIQMGFEYHQKRRLLLQCYVLFQLTLDLHYKAVCNYRTSTKS